MSAWKIVGRITDRSSEFARGKVGCQFKKRVYVSKEDFDKYSPEIIRRWNLYLKVKIEV
jgi:hypothetical protein